ncbi:MAG: APC family permease, partial [Segetibacter sp.]
MPIPVKKLKTVQLAAVIFLTVSGGPYGLEPLLTYAGNNAAILLLLTTPLLWDIPSILTVLELNSMMPVTGGYYQWVKRGLGLRWAFYEGWWTWLYTFVDLAIYPVLFVEYASFYFPEIQAYKIPVCLIIIWSSAALNIRGIVPVGKTSIFLGIVVLIPFVVLLVVALSKYAGHISFPAQTLRGHSFSSIGLALYTIMWNFIGWDNTTTYAEEVDKPGKSYLASIIVAFLIVLMIYTIAVLISIQAGISAKFLNEKGFPALGSLVGGHWLGALIAAGGMASALGLYSAVLLSVSRVPQVMAQDNLLPQILSSLHPKFNSPYISIVTCSAVVSLMILWTFSDLLIIDVTVYGAALFLEYIALIKLRMIAPDENRPFKIPLPVAGLCLMIIAPLTVYAIALIAAFTSDGASITPALFALATILT